MSGNRQQTTYKTIRVKGDGNCAFNAFSISLVFEHLEYLETFINNSDFQEFFAEIARKLNVEKKDVINKLKEFRDENNFVAVQLALSTSLRSLALQSLGKEPTKSDYCKHTLQSAQAAFNEYHEHRNRPGYRYQDDMYIQYFHPVFNSIKIKCDELMRVQSNDVLINQLIEDGILSKTEGTHLLNQNYIQLFQKMENHDFFSSFAEAAKEIYSGRRGSGLCGICPDPWCGGRGGHRCYRPLSQ